MKKWINSLWIKCQPLVTTIFIWNLILLNLDVIGVVVKFKKRYRDDIIINEQIINECFQTFGLREWGKLGHRA